MLSSPCVDYVITMAANESLLTNRLELSASTSVALSLSLLQLMIEKAITVRKDIATIRAGNSRFSICCCCFAWESEAISIAERAGCIATAGVKYTLTRGFFAIKAVAVDLVVTVVVVIMV